ncbi:hypothetical protein EA73_01981 [Enterococcus faecium]|uniref:hypothetical protein n=1 Tax=Enterococcus faecium TaxID=1352 RepID=UPI000DE8CC71|nr:hypothetical protein [Enterococcus faecium]RBT33782.1 hypothetical protein EA73_01981 [Enterococcus faecium]
MSLIEKIQETQNESFDKWFERWYKKQNLEDTIIKSAAEGYKGYCISIKETWESISDWDEDQKYLVRRLRDKRTVKKIQEKLGEGLKVKYVNDDKTYDTYFGLKRHEQSEYISIEWGEAE